jgi:prepilin-type processing-associated H-X9-DG protein
MSRVRWLVLVLGVVCLSCFLLLPFIQVIRDSEGWQRSQASLRQIGQALHLYHEVNGKLPPAVVRDKDGRPLYSWRVLLLPYLEHMQLYKQFNLEEAWDSPHNKKFLEQTPKCYLPDGGGMDDPGLTRYQVLIGPGTAFERPGLTWDDFPDGLAETILVVEAGEPVPWSKPADLAYDPDGPLPPLGGVFTKPVRFLKFEVSRRAGFNVLFADGSCRFIDSRTDERIIRSLITRNGGEKVDLGQLD